MTEFVGTGSGELVGKDPIEEVADELLIDSPDALITQFLELRGVTKDNGVSQIRKMHEALRKEQMLPTKSTLKLLVDLVEDGAKSFQQSSYQPREHGLRDNSCDFMSGLTSVIAEQLGLKAEILQVGDINQMRGIQREHSFSHEFTIVTDGDGKRFLVDLSFCQFIDPFTGKIYRGARAKDSDPDGGALAPRFITPGFVPLDDKTLNEYIRLLTRSGAHPDIDRLSVSSVLDAAPRYDLAHPRSLLLSHCDLGRIDQAAQKHPWSKFTPFSRNPFRFLQRT